MGWAIQIYRRTRSQSHSYLGFINSLYQRSQKETACGSPERNQDQDLGVETLIGHKSGQWIKGNFSDKKPTNGAQAVGSLITYFRRYSILSALNLGQEDDDGASASSISNAPDLATENQKKFLFKLMGMEEYMG